MKIVFLEADSLGEDMKLDHFFEIGEVVVYGKTTVEQVPEPYRRGGCSHRK